MGWGGALSAVCHVGMGDCGSVRGGGGLGKGEPTHPQYPPRLGNDLISVLEGCLLVQSDLLSMPCYWSTTGQCPGWPMHQDCPGPEGRRRRRSTPKLPLLPVSVSQTLMLAKMPSIGTDIGIYAPLNGSA